MIAHMTTILCYGLDKQDPTGFLLHTTGKAMRLEVGYNGKLLAVPLILADNVTLSWIKHVWVSTQEAGITISTDFAEVHLQWQGDIELMRLFVQNGWKQPELHMLNHCRMFLQVFLLSDIVLGSGDTITPEYWDQTIPSISTLDWPRTHAPTKSAWALWKMALTLALHLGRNWRLALPLGRWQEQLQPNGWYYHPITNSVWEVCSTQWVCHGGLAQCTRQRWFHINRTNEPPPPMSEVQKATVACHGQKLCLTGYDECEVNNQH